MYRRLHILAQFCIIFLAMGCNTLKHSDTQKSQNYDTITNIVHDTILRSSVENMARIEYIYRDTALKTDVHVTLTQHMQHDTAMIVKLDTMTAARSSHDIVTNAKKTRLTINVLQCLVAAFIGIFLGSAAGVLLNIFLRK